MAHPLFGLQSHLAALLSFAVGRRVDPDAIDLAVPKSPSGADLATTAALRFAPKGHARAVAESVAKGIMASMDSRVTSITADGPGYLNIVLSPSAFAAIAKWSIDAGPGTYGHGTPTNTLPIPTVVEFVSANPTGPLHVGHTRGAVVGDAIARLLAFSGRPITREYYVNDAGAQIDALGRSVQARWAQAAGLEATVPADGYPGAYLAPVGASLAACHGAPGPDSLATATAFGLESMIASIKDDLGTLGVAFDRFVSERDVQAAALEAALAKLRAADLLVEAIPPKAADGGGGEGTCLMVRTTLFGDDQDRVVVKANGELTYYAGDLAHFQAAIAAGERRFVLVLGADHAGYKARLHAAVHALSDGKATLTVVFVGLVSLMENGESVTMSKRAGRFETLADLVGDLGADAVRFSMLSRAAQTPLGFDLAVARAAAKENPAFYVQYASARLASVARSQPQPRVDSRAFCDADRALMVKVALWPLLAAIAAERMDPHMIFGAAMDLAADVHALWAKAKADPVLRLSDAPERAAVAAAAASALGSALALLGLEPAQRMERPAT